MLDEFEKTAWAGLEPDRYAWTVVEHRERGGGVHVHILAARCDLKTGPEPEHRAARLAAGFRRAARRLLEPAGRPEAGEGAPARPPRLHQGGAVATGLEHEADARELIRDYLTQRVEHGALRSRTDVIAALQDAGLEVPRQGKTVQNPDHGKRWRLKGALYEHDFEPGRLDRVAPAPAGGRPAGDGADRRAASPLSVVTACPDVSCMLLRVISRRAVRVPAPQGV